MTEVEVQGGNYFAYRGRSMWPCFQDGDILVTRRLSKQELRPGDCIVFCQRDSAEKTIHRIVSVTPEIWTQGDARPARDDEPVDPSRILGRVEERIRFGCGTRVAGGKRGVLAGKFYRYAGRIEPARDARGGRVARLVRGLSCRLIPLFGYRPRIATDCGRNGNSPVDCVLLGKRVVGSCDRDSGRINLFWPFSIFLLADRIPVPPRGSEWRKG